MKRKNQNLPSRSVRPHNQNNVLSLPNLLVLTEDVVVSILLLVLETGFGHFCRTKETCKRIKQIAESPIFYKSVDFFYMRVPWHEHNPSRGFINASLEHNNPSALLLKGVSQFFFEDKPDEGLRKIKRAASLRWETAVYIHSMMNKTLLDNKDERGYEFRLNRVSTTATATRKMILARDREVWLVQPCALLFERRDNIHIYKLKSCKCAKKSEMCDNCYWVKESLFFCNIIADHFGRWGLGI